jgi:hypothetical protein
MHGVQRATSDRAAKKEETETDGGRDGDDVEWRLAMEMDDALEKV